MIKLCYEYLPVRCIWLYVMIMSRTIFRVNPHSIVCLNVKKFLARYKSHIWTLSDINGIWTHNHLVCKRKLRMAKWLSQMIDFIIKTYKSFYYSNYFHKVVNFGSQYLQKYNWDTCHIYSTEVYLKYNLISEDKILVGVDTIYEAMA